MAPMSATRRLDSLSFDVLTNIISFLKDPSIEIELNQIPRRRKI
jgi:hypothetical protein